MAFDTVSKTFQNVGEFCQRKMKVVWFLFVCPAMHWKASPLNLQKETGLGRLRWRAKFAQPLSCKDVSFPGLSRQPR